MRYFVNAIAEYKFVLVLNSMMGNTEGATEFGPYDTRDQLLTFYEGELVEPYMDEGPDLFDYSGSGKTKKYSKTFRKGGPLEWYNPLHGQEFYTPGYYGHGIHEVLVGVDSINKLELLS